MALPPAMRVANSVKTEAQGVLISSITNPARVSSIKISVIQEDPRMKIQQHLLQFLLN
jgi:hypothetical protein